MKLTNFAMSMRIPTPWSTFLDTILKEIESLPLFKAKVKETLLSHNNDLLLFSLY